jgi:hypothetical protein
MADFLNTFKRRESDDSSEGSLAEDDEEFVAQFAHEEIRHHSDEGEDQREGQKRPQKEYSKPSSHEEKKQIRENKNRKEKQSPNKDQSQKKDYYLYQGEEKPYESDPDEQGQGPSHGKRENQKGEKKDPTFVPKGTFYQHDTRGDDVEFVPKKNNDKFAKQKWKHDKFEKPYSGKYEKSNRDNAENNNFYEKKGQNFVMYVPKGGEPQQKQQGEEEQPQPQPQRQKQQRNQQSYEKDDYRNDDYGKNDYGKGNYGKEKDRGYNYSNNNKYREYSKKETNRKQGGGNAGGRGNQDYIVEYVPKTQDKK